LMVLLLLLPLASGWQMPADPKAIPISTPNGEERLLVLEEGVWTSADWQELLDQGVQPLRSVSPQRLLVWMVGPVELARGVESLPFNDAAFFGAVDASGRW